MSFSIKTTFEDLSSELYISIFEYLNANELIYSFFYLNQYFNQLLRNSYLLLHCSLIDDHNSFDTLLSAICLRQLKSLKCYDYHLLQFDNLDNLLCLDLLVIFKYATNIREETIINSILTIPKLKYCQIKMSQSHGQIPVISRYHHENQDQSSSSLECLDIDSKSSLSFTYFRYYILRRLPYLRQLNVNLTCYEDNRSTMYRFIDPLINLSKLTLQIQRTNLEHLHLLSQSTANLEYLKLDCSSTKSESFLDAQKWFQLLSSWTNLKFLRINVRIKCNTDYYYDFNGVSQRFTSIPFLVERHLWPVYSESSTNRRQICFNAYFQKK